MSTTYCDFLFNVAWSIDFLQIYIHVCNQNFDYAYAVIELLL